MFGSLTAVICVIYLSLHGVIQADAQRGSTFGGTDRQKMATWFRRRWFDFDYQPPPPTPGEEQVVVTLHVTGAKRKIFCISDLHIGRFDEALSTTLETYLNSIRAIAQEEVVAVALLGDILEGWLDPIGIVPPSPITILSRWQTAAGNVLINAVNDLTQNKGVRVFLTRGNHDHEIDENVINALFGPQLEYIKGRLILRLDQGSSVPEYRIALSHGHEFEIFDTYSLTATNQLFRGNAYGYYLGRASATGSDQDLTQCGSKREDRTEALIRKALQLIPFVVGPTLVRALATPFFQRRFTKWVVLGALSLPQSTDPATVIFRLPDSGSFTLEEFMEYPHIRNVINQFSVRTVFEMFQAFYTDYTSFVRKSEEDVVVFGHTHESLVKTRINRRFNRIIHADTGAWNRCTRKFSGVQITPPSATENGALQVQNGDNRVGI